MGTQMSASERREALSNGSRPKVMDTIFLNGMCCPDIDATCQKMPVSVPLKRDEVRPMANPNWSNTYIKPSEVVVHNKPWDCWVSMMGIVKDLTLLVEQYMGSLLIKPILAHAGKDISCWFGSDGEIQTCIHPVTGVRVPYLPFGFVPHVNTDNMPHVDWEVPVSTPWWKDDTYNVARLTVNARPVRIMNVSTRSEILLHVCEEETINQIQDRYMVYNSNAESYTWKFQGVKLDMNKTLTENHIFDFRERFRFVGLPDDTYVPSLMLYYNDDFKFILQSK